MSHDMAAAVALYSLANMPHGLQRKGADGLLFCRVGPPKTKSQRGSRVSVWAETHLPSAWRGRSRGKSLTPSRGSAIADVSARTGSHRRGPRRTPTTESQAHTSPPLPVNIGRPGHVARAPSPLNLATVYMYMALPVTSH